MGKGKSPDENIFICVLLMKYSNTGKNLPAFCIGKMIPERDKNNRILCKNKHIMKTFSSAIRLKNLFLVKI
jgi:hypothetical protein